MSVTTAKKMDEKNHSELFFQGSMSLSTGHCPVFNMDKFMHTHIKLVVCTVDQTWTWNGKNKLNLLNKINDKKYVANAKAQDDKADAKYKMICHHAKQNEFEIVILIFICSFIVLHKIDIWDAEGGWYETKMRINTMWQTREINKYAY